MLKHECHLHLYGCLQAADLWEVAANRARIHASRFQWFLGEYERLAGISLDPALWWSSGNGYAHFKKIYLCDKPISFEFFQAKFNLLIALFPPNPEDLWLPEKVFRLHSRDGGFKEYRTFLPLYLPEAERSSYLRRVLELARDFESSTYHPRLAISLLRAEDEAWTGYHFLRGFLDQYPDLARFVTGIDFCASERGHPPKSKRDFFLRVLADNKAHHPLAILYHVGEMWQDISIASAARWCVEATLLGAHRLGHALALGMDVAALKGSRIRETAQEAKDHLDWIRLHLNELQSFGFGPVDYQWILQRSEELTASGSVAWHYDDDLIEHTTKFQDAAMGMIASRNPVVECCPTSNMRIGQLKKPSQHPLNRFLKKGLRVTVATDDPGIFDITLVSEENLLREEFKLSDNQIQKLDDVARQQF